MQILYFSLFLHILKLNYSSIIYGNWFSSSFVACQSHYSSLSNSMFGLICKNYILEVYDVVLVSQIILVYSCWIYLVSNLTWVIPFQLPSMKNHSSYNYILFQNYYLSCLTTYMFNHKKNFVIFQLLGSWFTLTSNCQLEMVHGYFLCTEDSFVNETE